MAKSQDEVIQKAAKRAKQEKVYIFRKKGHQEQHDFNECMSVCLEEVGKERSPNCHLTSQR